jgi:GH43 family beta-xylosidase
MKWRSMRIVLIGAIFGQMLTMIAANETSSHTMSGNTYKNPIASNGADPWVIWWQGAYYYCYSFGESLGMNKAARLQDIDTTTERRIVWESPSGQPYSKELWAPELHYLDGKWYIYVAADDGKNEHHRMYVLEGMSQDPQGKYALKGQITDPTNKWAIDGTILVMDSGAKYFIWSGWEGDVNVQQNLYIAPMSNPWTISGKHVLISKPELPWELIGTPLINEGPEILKHNGKVFIIYSASGSWTDDYCLGQLTLIGNDPLQPSSWQKKPTPVFSKTTAVFGPGHASFVKSPDGKEDWIVYHAAKYKGARWNRNVRIQRFSWDAEGHPVFGTPVEKGVELEGPSGQP